MKRFKKGMELDSIIKNEKILLIQFGTKGCNPCLSIENKIDKWEYLDKIESIYISIEDFPQISAQKSIFSAPTILVFIEGKESIRKSGYFSLDEIFQQLERYLNLL